MRENRRFLLSMDAERITMLQTSVNIRCTCCVHARRRCDSFIHALNLSLCFFMFGRYVLEDMSRCQLPAAHHEKQRNYDCQWVLYGTTRVERQMSMQPLGGYMSAPGCKGSSEMRHCVENWISIGFAKRGYCLPRDP